MAQLTLGVNIDDLRLPVKEGLRRAGEMGFREVEFGAVAGELTPESLSDSGRRHFLKLLEGLNLRVVAMVADMPQLRWTDAARVEERVARTRRVMDLAADLGVRIVTTSIGAVTHPDSGEPSPAAMETLRQLCDHADRRGRLLALRPTYDAGERLKRVFRELNCAALKVTLDPAVLVMTGANPLATVESFANDIALVYGRDGTAGERERPGEETRVGGGDVDFAELFSGLEDGGFRGSLVLRRANSQTPLVDLEGGRAFLSRFGL